MHQWSGYVEYKRKRRVYNGRNQRFLDKANGTVVRGRIWGQVMAL